MKILVVNRYLVNLILLLGDWKYSYIAIIFFRITVQSFKGNFQFGSLQLLISAIFQTSVVQATVHARKTIYWVYDKVAILMVAPTIMKVQTTMRLIIVWELQMEMYLKIFVFLFSLNAFPTNSCVKI